MGGYGPNAYNYSFFLEEIGQPGQATDILKKTISQLPSEDIEARALVWARLGKLLNFVNKEEALKAYKEAVVLFELLFADGFATTYRIPLAEANYRYGNILVEKSLVEARRYLERALILLCNLGRGDQTTLLLTFLTMNSLAYLHQQLNDDKQTGSYLIIALETAGMLAIENPDESAVYLFEAIKRLKIFFGEEEGKKNAALFYQRALNYFLIFHNNLSLEENYRHASSLVSIGMYLLTVQETTGAEICFKKALNIFRKVEKEGYPCITSISDALGFVGFIHMTQNNVKAHKRVISEALNIHRKLINANPVEHLSKIASYLDRLYINSFIGVPPSQFYRANQFFEEALKIYKCLDTKHKQPNINDWKHLLQHKSTMLSRKMDKTDAIIFYQELSYLKSRIAALQPNANDEWFQLSMHELGELLLINLYIDHPLFDSITHDIIVARTSLFETDPEKYRLYLAVILSKVGQILLEGSQKKKACTYLQRAIVLLKELIAKEPTVLYEKALVMPMFKLAYEYALQNNYTRALPYFIELCDYFENRLDENPEYLTILVSYMLSTTEVLISNEQKEKALEYIVRAQLYIPDISNNAERIRLEESFRMLKSKLSR